VPSLNRAYQNIIKIKSSWYAVEIVDELIRSKNSDFTIREIEKIKFTNFIEINNLEFSYPEMSQPLFKNLNLKLHKGDFVGIIGKSGSGKSTLLNILAGLIKTNKTLKIDGHYLSKTEVKSWYEEIGFVSQDSYILNGTICQNVAFGIKKENVDKEKVIKTLEMVQLGNWLQYLPLGIDTVIGENGSKISEGQKQRIALAKVLFKSSNVLLFDEITGNLDFETEDSIIELLTNLNKSGKTIVFVSHRKRALKNCNRVFGIEDQKLYKNDNDL
jgi:ABC-type bacteriocin/lantibiotic exporter with double-glycine peptidase domain